jgi:hypothetical protein
MSTIKNVFISCFNAQGTKVSTKTAGKCALAPWTAHQPIEMFFCSFNFQGSKASIPHCKRNHKCKVSFLQLGWSVTPVLNLIVN